jgi:hypothetical protein
VSLFKRRPLAVLAVACVLVGIGAAATAIAFPTGGSGGTITGVQVVRETAANATTSESWVPLPGAQTSITVPSGQRALIMARFSGESDCENTSGDPGRCNVRILIGGVEGAPGSGDDFAFDSNDYPGFDTRESHSMDRSRSVNAGTYTIQVQYKVTPPAETFTLDDWSLTVERAVGFP